MINVSSLFERHPSPSLAIESLKLSNASLDTDGIQVACEGFHPECLLESLNSGFCFRVKGASPLHESKYEVTYEQDGLLYDARQKVADLFTIVFFTGSGSPGITAFLGLDRTLHCQKEDFAKIRDTYIRLLWKAWHSINANGVQYTLEEFKMKDNIHVTSIKVHEFSAAFRNAAANLDLKSPFRHMRTFFQLQHGHRNLIEELNISGNILSESSTAAVDEHMRGLVFSRFNMSLVTSVSLSLGAQMGVVGGTIYVNSSVVEKWPHWREDKHSTQRHYLCPTTDGTIYAVPQGMGERQPMCNFQMNGTPQSLRVLFDEENGVPGCHITSTQGYNTIWHDSRDAAMSNASSTRKYSLHEALSGDNGHHVRITAEMLRETKMNVSRLIQLHARQAQGGVDSNTRLETILTVEKKPLLKSTPVSVEAFKQRILNVIHRWGRLAIEHMREEILQTDDEHSMYQVLDSKTVGDAKIYRTEALLAGIEHIHERIMRDQPNKLVINKGHNVSQGDRLAIQFMINQLTILATNVKPTGLDKLTREQMKVLKPGATLHPKFFDSDPKSATFLSVLDIPMDEFKLYTHGAAVAPTRREAAEQKQSLASLLNSWKVLKSQSSSSKGMDKEPTEQLLLKVFEHVAECIYSDVSKRLKTWISGRKRRAKRQSDHTNTALSDALISADYSWDRDLIGDQMKIEFPLLANSEKLFTSLPEVQNFGTLVWHCVRHSTAKTALMGGGAKYSWNTVHTELVQNMPEVLQDHLGKGEKRIDIQALFQKACKKYGNVHIFPDVTATASNAWKYLYWRWIKMDGCFVPRTIRPNTASIALRSTSVIEDEKAESASVGSRGSRSKPLPADIESNVRRALELMAISKQSSVCPLDSIMRPKRSRTAKVDVLEIEQSLDGELNIKTNSTAAAGSCSTSTIANDPPLRLVELIQPSKWTESINRFLQTNPAVQQCLNTALGLFDKRIVPLDMIATIRDDLTARLRGVNSYILWLVLGMFPSRIYKACALIDHPHLDQNIETNEIPKQLSAEQIKENPLVYISFREGVPINEQHSMAMAYLLAKCLFEVAFAFKIEEAKASVTVEEASKKEKASAQLRVTRNENALKEFERKWQTRVRGSGCLPHLHASLAECWDKKNILFMVGLHETPSVPVYEEWNNAMKNKRWVDMLKLRCVRAVVKDSFSIKSKKDLIEQAKGQRFFEGRITAAEDQLW